MESKTTYLSVLAMCMWLILVRYEASAAEESKGKELIENICKERGNRELCVEVLTSDPSSAEADLKDLAMISLKAAAENARDILVDAKKMIDNPDLEPSMQQGLADCKENLLDAESQINDAVASILSNNKHDAQLWLKAALAAIDTCDNSIPGDDDILSKRSVEFRQLCNIAVAINKAMMGVKY
ncbi:Pectinesterase inhibitor [Spatholobus suberectus]|nr:Pectinesterase inhibitor [Spatholobus suberectus]